MEPAAVPGRRFATNGYLRRAGRDGGAVWRAAGRRLRREPRLRTFSISSRRNSTDVVTPRLDSGFGMQSAAPSDIALKLASALWRVSVEAMMTTRSRSFPSSSGSAASPSRSGISISRRMTSGVKRSSWSTASRPVRSEATTLMPGSASSQRATNPRTTTLSSTTITRIACCGPAWIETAGIAKLIRSREC